MFKPIKSIVETIAKLSPFCIPMCSLRLVLSFLCGPLLFYLFYKYSVQLFFVFPLLQLPMHSMKLTVMPIK